MLLIWIFAAVKMQIISKILLTILVVKITNFHIIIQYSPLNYHLGLKIVILTPKIVENIYEIIRIFTAAKNHISNFADTHFDPDYCTPSKIVPHRVKNS